jgi:lipoic acid synthetase
MPVQPSRSRIDPEKINPRPIARPDWIKVRSIGGDATQWLKDLMQRKELHTVCEEAFCPNMGECWGAGTATFLILGDICTRSCGFCDIKRGKPSPVDINEPERVAQAAKLMGLKHAVITSVDRDDLPDGGARIFSTLIELIHATSPGCSVEVLIPDFKGDQSALKLVMDAHPEILNHNVETVPSLFRRVQPQDKLEWSKAILQGARRMDATVLTKSGIMVGLGETMDEIWELMRLLREWDVDILTIGQYLQPSRRHLPIERYYTMEEFAELKTKGLEMGFKWVESAPLVRSSYHAVDQVQQLSKFHQTAS